MRVIPKGGSCFFSWEEIVEEFLLSISCNRGPETEGVLAETCYYEERRVCSW